MFQTFGQVITELPHMDRHFIKRWWCMRAYLNIDITIPARPNPERDGRLISSGNGRAIRP
jgi:hypothetical protein